MKKNLLKIAALLIAMLSAVNVSAQFSLPNLPITYGVEAGLTLSNFATDNKNADFSAILGYSIGVTAEYSITEQIFLQSGLSLLTKGAKRSESHRDSDGSYEFEMTARPMLFQLPVHAAYKFQVKEGIIVNVNAGPYLALGIGGKIKHEDSFTDRSGDTETEKGDENFFGSEKKGGFKNIDYGFGIGTGVEIGKISINLTINWGAANLSRSSVSELKLNCTALSVGHKF